MKGPGTLLHRLENVIYMIKIVNISFPSGVKLNNVLFQIPHLENHPLENDQHKSSYNSPGAVNSYGEPIKPTNNLENPHQFYLNPSKPPSDIKDQGKFSYNSPGAVDSYGLPVTAENLQNNLDNEKLLQQAYYLNQLNEIHDISRRRRQGSQNSGEARSSREDVRHPNHRYD